MNSINNNYLTPQEHSLFGSTMSEKYLGKPYTPIAVQDGMSPEECNDERNLEGKLSSIPGGYWGVKYIDCEMSLELLNLDKDSDNYGKTILSPAIIKYGIHFPKMPDFSKDFPNKRLEDPRVEIENE